MATTEITERDVVAHFKKRLAELKGEIRKVRWIGRKNAPDSFVMIPGSRANFWAEFKRPGYPRTALVEAQEREHERMRAFDEIVIVIDSYAAADRALGVRR